MLRVEVLGAANLCPADKKSTTRFVLGTSNAPAHELYAAS